MQEIATGRTENLQLVIYSQGNKVNADGVVTVTIYNADSASYSAGVYSNTALVTASAFNAPPEGLYTYSLGPPITSTNQTLQVVWSYSINGVATSETTLIKIDTPYATISDIIDYYGFGVTPNTPNYQSEKQISHAEKIARKVIDKYTQQTFGLRWDSQEVISPGSDALWLLEPMINIDQVWEDDELVIDNTQNPVYNDFGYPLQLTDSRFVVRIVNMDWDIYYDNQVDPTILYYGQFQNMSRYRFSGMIGYLYVPDDIREAAILLTGDYLSNDAAWRAKYLKSVSMSETSFALHNGAFNGTGNLIVDSILDDYRNPNMVII